MNRRHIVSLCSLPFTSIFIAGCANGISAGSQNDLKHLTWSGKLSLRIPAENNQPGAPAQVHNAGFDLQGDAQTGQLRLTTPLGTTAALVEWLPQQATLTVNGVSQTFADLNALSRHLLGTHVPVVSFFDWLAGHDRSVDGWTVDLSQWSHGRITARRHLPAPPAELRLLIEP